MIFTSLLLSAAPVALAMSVVVDTANSATTTDTAEPAQSDAKPAGGDVVTTGVARGRDRLDSAVSTSVLKQSDIAKLAPRSITELLRDIPGIRSEASSGENNGSISIRGLPIASNGAKFVQLQEDGLPVVEFGDMLFGTADSFLRADLNLAQVDVIRGGSASTFASNSPGGIINFISKTGEVEGGAVQVSSGLDYDEYRLDFDYGTKISDTLRFHVGGFFRQGEGPRRAGYDAVKGGQIKLNVTKDFDGGYIRFYGKYLDDHAPVYNVAPMRVTGTNAKPSYAQVANFDVNNDVLQSRYITDNVTLDEHNNLTTDSVRSGQHGQVKSFGFETQFDAYGWAISERFRYSDIKNHFVGFSFANIRPAAAALTAIGGAGATLRYANGPLGGQVVADPSTLNGNGLLSSMTLVDTKAHSFDNVTNDLRASRVWDVGNGDLTTTAGVYNARQTIDTDYLWTTILTGIRGDGRATLMDVTDANGRAITQNGFTSYNFTIGPISLRKGIHVAYNVNAPFGSFNYHVGRVSVGGSLRYDYGKASGSIIGADLGAGRVGTVSRDINGDGVISVPETNVGVFPLTRPAPVDYTFGYLSYSTGINFRIAEPLAVFARYSRGGRANADRILFSSLVSFTDGSIRPGAASDTVTQAEAGVKYRQSDLTLNLTGFWAKAEDTNLDVRTAAPLSREYTAKGMEFEGGYRRGLFSLTAGATYTDAKLTKDSINAQLQGHVPRRQAKFIYQATPQLSNDRFSIGAAFIGSTGSFSQDVNLLRIPGYTTTNAFVQFRPVPRLLLSLNADNLFDTVAITSIDDASIPASGIVRVTPLNGRNVSASLRFDF